MRKAPPLPRCATVPVVRRKVVVEQPVQAAVSDKIRRILERFIIVSAVGDYYAANDFDALSGKRSKNKSHKG
jgi:hypothetical protein